MKKTLLAAAALICFAGAASAADLPARTYTKASPADVAINWTGFYAGLHAGYGWGDKGTDLAAHDPNQQGATLDFGVLPRSLAVPAHGAIGGLQAGYNFQSGPLLIGVETDLSASGLKGSRALSTDVPGWVQATITHEHALDTLGTARVRFGVLPSARWLVYATGGFAFGRATASTTVIDPTVIGTCVNTLCASQSASGWLTGWTLGGGTEFKVSQNWSTKLEYLYYDLGSLNYTFFNPNFPFSPGPNRGFDAKAGFNGHILRVGLNYQFN